MVYNPDADHWDHLFVVTIDGIEHSFTRWVDIPEEFDNLVKFMPVWPEQQRDGCRADTDLWSNRLKELLQREKT
tara:strand:+ start:2197 stop:2418 length:222 start_codon:yes stop_codon:yes gene_type:complete